MQQQTQNAPPSIPPNAVTTEQIQKYLDDNKNLILAIMETQNLGKLTECAQYQAQLQRNLTYLAAIADASQPQAPTMPSQTPMQSVMRQGHQMQQTPPGMVQQPGGLFASNIPFQLNSLQPQDQQQQQHQILHFQQQQLMQGSMGQRPGAGMMQHLQTGLGNPRNLVDAHGTRQDGSDAGSGDGQGMSASVRGGQDRES